MQTATSENNREHMSQTRTTIQLDDHDDEAPIQPSKPSGAEDTGGLSEEQINVVIDQCRVTRDVALRALQQNEFDLMRSITAITMGPAPASGDAFEKPAHRGGNDEAAALAALWEKKAASIPDQDIELVMVQAGVSREEALQALIDQNGDVVGSVMSLT
jgi:NACalpha-BTF3-like transcription factor